MNIWCNLLIRFSKIQLGKRLSRVFALKTRNRLFKTPVRWAFETLRENQKLQKIKSLKSSAKCSESFSEWLKSLATRLRYNTTHGVPIIRSKK